MLSEKGQLQTAVYRVVPFTCYSETLKQRNSEMKAQQGRQQPARLRSTELHPWRKAQTPADSSLTSTCELCHMYPKASEHTHTDTHNTLTN